MDAIIHKASLPFSQITVWYKKNSKRKRKRKIKWKNILIFHGVHTRKNEKMVETSSVDEDFPRDRHKRIGWNFPLSHARSLRFYLVAEKKKTGHKSPLVKVTCDPLDCFLHVFVCSPWDLWGPTQWMRSTTGEEMCMATSSSFRRPLIHSSRLQPPCRSRFSLLAPVSFSLTHKSSIIRDLISFDLLCRLFKYFHFSPRNRTEFLGDFSSRKA